MFYIESKSRDAAFNLSAEEYITRIFSVSSEVPVFMFWQTDKCVIFGRNQVAAAEIDLRAADSLGINILRRPSGGGAVFSDPGNIMFTLVTPFYPEKGDDPKKIEREYFAYPVARALNKIGVPAVVEGRNDITAGGRKFSGLAQYAVKNRLCSHGSMLYGSDLDMLARVLKPDPEKISSKALKSVRSRVVNLKEYFDPAISVFEFLEMLKYNLFGESGEMAAETKNYEFSEHDIKQINNIRREKYANPDWITGATPKFTVNFAKRFSAGKLEIFLRVERGIIKSCRIFGDFLGILPVSELEALLEDKAHDFKTLSGILSGIDLSLYLGGIKQEELLECLF
jgi:lipoate-protein ligase A